MKHMRRIVPVLILCIILTGCINHKYQSGLEDLQNGEYSAAIEKFEQVIEKEKYVGDSYRGIGIANWELGNYEEAVAAFEKALAQGAQETATIYHLLGACEMQLQEYAAAIAFYEQGIALEDCTDAMEQEMRLNVVAAYEKLGDIENAKVKIAEYVEKYPDDEAAAKEAEFLKTR